MALKKPSQAARTVDVSAAADQLADQLADKPYGALSEKAQQAFLAVTPKSLQVKKVARQEGEVPKARPLSISLPPEIVEQLEDQVRDNKRSGDGPKTVSGILRELLEKAGYTGATIRNK